MLYQSAARGVATPGRQAIERVCIVPCLAVSAFGRYGHTAPSNFHSCRLGCCMVDWRCHYRPAHHILSLEMQAGAHMNRIVIDTDPGVDDAHAIMLACAYPGAKVEALTTVAGNVSLDRATSNALI